MFTRATFGLFVARHRDWRRRPTPKPLSRRLSAEVEHVPMLGKKWHRYLRGSQSAPSRWTPPDLFVSEPFLTLSDTLCQFNGRHANGNDLLSRSIEDTCPCLRRSCKHLVNLCRASTAVTWRPTTRSQIGHVNRPALEWLGEFGRSRKQPICEFISHGCLSADAGTVLESEEDDRNVAASLA